MMASASIIMASLPRNIRSETSLAVGSTALSVALARLDLTPSDIDGVGQENVGTGQIDLHF
jgi:hypothetical protein